MGCFCKLELLTVGVLIIRSVLVGFTLRTLDLWRLPYYPQLYTLDPK